MRMCYRQSRDHHQAEAREQSTAAAQHSVTVKRLTALLTSVQARRSARQPPIPIVPCRSAALLDAATPLTRFIGLSKTAPKCNVLPSQAGGAPVSPAPAVQLSGCTVTMQLPGAQPPPGRVGAPPQAPAAPTVSPQPPRPRPQSSAPPSKSRSFLGRLQQMSKSPQKGRPQQTTVPAASAAAARPAVKQRAASVLPQTAEVRAGGGAASGSLPGGPVQLSSANCMPQQSPAASSTSQATAGADEGVTPESDNIDEGDVSWAVTLPSRPAASRPASVPLLRMDWGSRRTVSLDEADVVPA